jgi:hypothetical protein
MIKKENTEKLQVTATVFSLANIFPLKLRQQKAKVNFILAIIDLKYAQEGYALKWKDGYLIKF